MICALGCRNRYHVGVLLEEDEVGGFKSFILHLYAL